MDTKTVGNLRSVLSPTFHLGQLYPTHYNDVIMSTMASQITSPSIIYSTDYSGADQRKHLNTAWLAFVREIHRGLVNSPHKGPVTRKMFPFDSVIMDSFFSNNDGDISDRTWNIFERHFQREIIFSNISSNTSAFIMAWHNQWEFTVAYMICINNARNVKQCVVVCWLLFALQVILAVHLNINCSFAQNKIIIIIIIICRIFTQLCTHFVISCVVL